MSNASPFIALTYDGRVTSNLFPQILGIRTSNYETEKEQRRRLHSVVQDR
jgi:hypothetical protein